MNIRYSEILDQLISNLENIISNDITNILRNQLNFLKILLLIFPENIIHQLLPDQYYVISTLNSYLGKRHTHYWPYFFITRSESIGKFIF